MAIAQCNRKELAQHVGAWAELIACTTLLEYGLDVFRNVSQHGAHDLVVMRRDSFACVPVDITAGQWYQKTDKSYSIQSHATSKLKSGKCCKVIVVMPDSALYYAWLEYVRGDAYLKFKPFDVSDLFPPG